MEQRPTKTISLYTTDEKELWERAESAARDSQEHREGEVLAKICEYYVKAVEQ